MGPAHMPFDAATLTLYSLAEEFKSLSLTVTKLVAIFFNIGRHRQKPVLPDISRNIDRIKKKFKLVL